MTNKANHIPMAIMRSSLLWGISASLAFYALIHMGVWQDDFALRYFAGHWVQYVETAMFFVGLSALILKTMDVMAQSADLERPLLPRPAAAGPPARQAEQLLTHLAELPAHRRTGYLAGRLRDALENVRFAGSADKLGDELKYLSESDAARSHAGFGLLRIIIWAIPILGFLGTVIGITMAIASLNPQALEDSLPTVTGGLGVAFDTTALALGLSMVLMFVQFFVDRMESRLLAEVDLLAVAELAGRFDQFGSDPQLAAVRRMADEVIKSAERLAQRQAEVWRGSIEASEARYTQLVSRLGGQLQTALGEALAQAIEHHAEKLAAAEHTSAEKNRVHWAQVQQALAESSRAAQSQQAELARQADVLLRVVEATGQVTRLEQALNGNLAALAGAQHFEETLLSLAGAIHLLNARLGQVAALTQVELGEHTSVGKAA
ncbi:MAG: MotA/TolQ/ExbB proton channel family protein [Pirellulales bacterium]